MDRNFFKKERQTVENDEIYLFLSGEECKKFNTAFETQNNRNCSSQTNRCETLYIIKEREPSALRTAPAGEKSLHKTSQGEDQAWVAASNAAANSSYCSVV